MFKHHVSTNHLTILTPSRQEIIKDLSLSILPGTKLAIIGAEGSGKSTLLKALAGLPLPGFQIKGEIQQGNIGYLSQSLEPEWTESVLPVQYMLAQNMEQEAKDWDWESYQEAYTALMQVGLQKELLDEERPFITLSGGENVRFRIAKLLKNKPDIILLDEPTNYLDLKTIQWLEEFIINTTLPIAFVTHDEWLIEKAANQILFIQYFEYKNICRHILTGEDYQTFLTKKEREYQKAQSETNKNKTTLKRFKQEYNKTKNSIDSKKSKPVDGGMAEKNSASRGISKTSSKLAKIKKTIDNIDLISSLDREEEIKIDFPLECQIANTKNVIEYKADKLGYQNKICAMNIHLSVQGPEKVVIIGKNGIGKSTLLRAIYTNLLQKGDFSIGYVPQDPSEVLTDPNKSAIAYLDEIQIDKTLNRNTLRRLNFQRIEMELSIKNLSGGQKIKLLLARAILSRSNVLLLDEPTTNLSPLSSPSLRLALKEFPGTVIIISHDRTFINNVATQIYEMTFTGLNRLSAYSKPYAID